MNISNSKKAFLLLEDGSIYEGFAAGRIGTTTGEICFNTGMTGYQEIFTDPSYYGQVMVNTNVHIGNYGVANDDEESEDVQISGLVCRNLNSGYSRPLASESLQDYLEQNGIVCIHNIDTREIVRKVREKGAMNCIISSEEHSLDSLKDQLSKAPKMEGRELASQVSTREAYSLGNPNSDIRIAVLDFGTKRNILNCLVDRGAYLKVFPAKTDLSELVKFNPDGYFLSNGPGDPAAMEYAISTARDVIKTGKPVFGICLGHQLIALSQGISTHKMHHGHRGANHPVKNVITGKCEVTSQNHGFGISLNELQNANHVRLTHLNLNDDSVEGLELKNNPVFSVQFHPEAAPGPHDSRYLFDQFIDLIKKQKNN
ncbi:MAG TPA: glutamine-hydrolyzing carbamoyl-phosphate synthase small subunit [Saprospiraceae bacterium]|nr:glutamine-hydrolyzing carbamoyl-phosphate synthase small subunit [Saprospiraceae bacterium]